MGKTGVRWRDVNEVIDWWFLASNFGLPGVGGFLGSLVANYLSCPNRGCCQMRRIREAIEKR